MAARRTPSQDRLYGALVSVLAQIGTAGTTAHTVTPRVSTYGRPRPALDADCPAPLPAVPGTARGIARAPVRGVAAVPASQPTGLPGRSRAADRSAPARRRGSGGHRGWPWGRRRDRSGVGQVAGAAGRARAGTPRFSPVALALIVVGVFVAGFGFERVTGTPLARWLPGADRHVSPEHPPMAASDPVSLTIPSLRLQAAVHDVGLADDGTIAVPELNRHNEAGWYVASPTPGENGPAVIVGHVDTTTGPSVFYQASTLQPGAKIQIRRMDGSVAVFEVNSVERFDKSSLPAERVYADYSRPGLRLITCGGQWVGGSTGYADNVVVFASLVDAEGG
ncbi:class F sortase [Solwaraspora sp. WMMD791]|uniref:class F sortase n=1 Tax=Solwaraspora sp. WMMD791 TaxID=3016086 RepID=UPI002499AE7B|nr:class F sortase [Solwaraspora sp. WMMD791]WFE30029.1 class F sortase [Solwaraspora sp. WMMD791]